VSTDFSRLAGELEADFGASGAEPWSEDVFGRRALEVFRVQYEACGPYRALCDARGVTPDTAQSWADAPMVPASAFKVLDLVSAPPSADALLFRTSGTTRGGEARGRHHVPRPSLYRAALLPPLRAALVPDVERIRFVSLIPSPAEAPESSLSFMVGAAAEALATRVDWMVHADGRWSDRFDEVWPSIVDEGAPVLLLGTALAFLHAMEGPGLGRLPAGSRVMETGGFKGARRDVSRGELYAGISARTGVDSSRIVNEYGMTELLSQLWEPVLTEGLERGRVHVPAPWLRVRALDPVSLAPLREGSEGVLSFFDPANLGSVSHVLTEDIGALVDGRVRLRGRTPGAEPRGCSRAMDELMSAAGR
jgi:hypothetical protein